MAIDIILKNQQVFKKPEWKDFISVAVLLALLDFLFFKRLHFTTSVYLLFGAFLFEFFINDRQLFKPNWLDLSITVVFIYENVSYFCRWSSFSVELPYLKEITIVFLFYSILRTVLNNRQRWLVFIICLSLFICLFTLFSYILFLHFDVQVTGLFTSNVSNFKGFFSPFHYLINDWAAILLCFLCFVFIAFDFIENRNLLLWLFLPVILGVFTTFSRGAYLAFLIAFPIFAYALIKGNYGNKFSSLNIWMFFLVVILLSLPFIDSIITTLKSGETDSQAKSIVGRYQLIKVASSIFFKNYFWGIGNGNFSIYASRYFENDNIHFTSRVTNSLVQAFCEKGIIGTTVWTLPILSILHGFKNNKIDTSLIWGSITSFVILFIKEMTFSTFFESIEMKLMIIVVFSYFSFYYSASSNIEIAHYIKATVIILILIMVSATIIIAKKKQQADIENNFAFITAEPNEKLLHEKNANKIFPFEPAYTINTSIIYWNLFKQKSERSYLDSAEIYGKKSVAHNCFDFQLQSNLYWIYYYQNKKEMAINKMKELVRSFPQCSLYSLSVAEMYKLGGKSDSSVHYYAQSSKYSPAVLKNLEISDSVLYTKVVQEVEKELHSYNNSETMLNTDPIQLSKDGQLFYILKETARAESILKGINKSFPNLNRPYLFLSLIDLQNKNQEDYLTNLRRAAWLNKSDYLTCFYQSEYLRTIGNIKKSKETLQLSINNYRTIASIHYSKAINWYTAKTFENDIIPQNLLYQMAYPLPITLSLKN